MTNPSRLPTLSSTSPLARPRRVKRGIVAGYIHDISPRHRGAAEPLKAAPSVPIPTTSAAPAPAIFALEPQQA
jgi:hypothetical protein